MIVFYIIDARALDLGDATSEGNSSRTAEKTLADALCGRLCPCFPGCREQDGACGLDLSSVSVVTKLQNWCTVIGKTRRFFTAALTPVPHIDRCFRLADLFYKLP